MSAAAAVPLRQRRHAEASAKVQPRAWNPFEEKQPKAIPWYAEPDLIWQLKAERKIRGDGQHVMLAALMKDQWGRGRINVWSEPLSDRELANKIARLQGLKTWRGDLNEVRLNRDDAVDRGLILVERVEKKRRYCVCVHNWPQVKPVSESSVVPVPRKPAGRSHDTDSVGQGGEGKANGSGAGTPPPVTPPVVCGGEGKANGSGAGTPPPVTPPVVCKPIILKNRGEQKALWFPRPVGEMRVESALESPLALEPRVEGTVLFIRILDPSPPGAQAPKREAQPSPATAQDLPILAEAVGKLVSGDKYLVQTLVTACRAKRLDCTLAEIAYFVGEKGKELGGREGIAKQAKSTPGGLLVASVANALEAGLDDHRAERLKAKQREAQAKQREEEEASRHEREAEEERRKDEFRAEFAGLPAERKKPYLANEKRNLKTDHRQYFESLSPERQKEEINRLAASAYARDEFNSLLRELEDELEKSSRTEGER